MLAFWYGGHQSLDVEGILAKRPGRDLAMKDEGRNIGIVVCDLSPTVMAAIRRHPDEADELVRERLDGCDLHGSRRQTVGPAVAREMRVDFKQSITIRGRGPRCRAGDGSFAAAAFAAGIAARRFG